MMDPYEHCARCGVARVSLAALDVAGGTLELVPVAFHEDVDEPYRLALDARACARCGAIALRTTELDYAETLAEVLGSPSQARCPRCDDAPQLYMPLQDSPFLVRAGKSAGTLQALVCRRCGWARLAREAPHALAAAPRADRAWCACGVPAVGPFSVSIRAIYDSRGAGHAVRQERLVVSWEGDDASDVRACSCPACDAVELYAPRPAVQT